MTNPIPNWIRTLVGMSPLVRRSTMNARLGESARRSQTLWDRARVEDGDRYLTLKREHQKEIEAEVAKTNSLMDAAHHVDYHHDQDTDMYSILVCLHADHMVALGHYNDESFRERLADRVCLKIRNDIIRSRFVHKARSRGGAK